MANDTFTLLPHQLATDVTFLIKLVEALGGVIIVYLVFNIVNFFIVRKNRKEIQKINQNLEEIKEMLKKQKK